VSGLKPGDNTLELRVAGVKRSSLRLVNHPLTGPLFSGPHQQPFVCQTEANGLGPASDPDCSAKTIVQYYYKSTEPTSPFPLAEIVAEFYNPPGSFSAGFKAYNPASPPSDVAQTVTSDGHMVPYIVRRELGTLNRAVYDIQFLHQPGQPLPNPWASSTPGWNGRLVYVFEGGCGTGHHQGTLGILGGPQEPLLAQGYAVATSTLNVFATDCNDRVSAETLSMVKEHFIKEFGAPAHTIGWGESGGAMQVYLTAQNYPGLLDGILPIKNFPDMMSFVQFTADCTLVDSALNSSGSLWTQPQKTAVSGFASWRMCELITRYKIRPLDAQNCDASLPKGSVYNPTDNPRGARCDLFDSQVNTYGRDPRTGLARRPFDNEGVQYGLGAFNSGKITAEQFVGLNEHIGGFDADGRLSPTRNQVDEETLRLVYERGLVLTGGGGLSNVPIIDWRPYSDELTSVDGHPLFLSLATRARLIAAYGNAGNQVIRVSPRETWFDWNIEASSGPAALLAKLDQWLDNIAADQAAGTAAEKVVRDRPPDLQSGCIGLDGENILAEDELAKPSIQKGLGRCNPSYTVYAMPRVVAGAPLSNDILKCALKPLSAADYTQPLSADQLKRLQAVFSSGVCDYTRPGVGQQMTRATWQRF